MAEATYGLRLSVGGAPLEAHAVEGVAGALFRPDIPTPVGGEGQIPLERARELADDPSIPLELVEIGAEYVEHAAALAAAALRKAREGLHIAAQLGLEGADLSRLHDEFSILTTPPTAGADRIGTPDPPTTNAAVASVVAAAPQTVATTAAAPAPEAAPWSAAAEAQAAPSDAQTSPPAGEAPETTTTTEG